MAIKATLHCLTGCAIGEILGMVLSTMWGWSALPSVLLSIGLAFLFGYALSARAIIRHGVPVRRAVRIAFAADTASIATMELVDNVFILLVPGAIHAELTSLLFWVSLAVSLFVAFWVAVPLNRFLIARGKGHALAHQHHHE